ncbi:hypothetical protein NPIL_591861 [Nephila pilipes]|uniref:Uncharacterized protein n=1 Tax=Nephila pilipes TaxID=299642 RepID=A0A8X6QUE1_NEPPI|nr:hypothetical protein NPIL_591861 [Nephila pilipes]
MTSEGSAESSNNHERQHQIKRRPPVRRNWRKRSAPSSLVENIEVKRRPHENCKWRKRPMPVSLPSGPGTRKMTRREAADERKVLSGRYREITQFNKFRRDPYASHLCQELAALLIIKTQCSRSPLRYPNASASECLFSAPELLCMLH